MFDEAYDKYTVVVHSDTWIEVYWETNDDYDHGYPTKYASDSYEFDSLDKALKFTGRSRQGIGHKVMVTVDGEPV